MECCLFLSRPRLVGFVSTEVAQGGATPPHTALSFRAPSLIKGGPYSDCEDRPGTEALGGGIKSNYRPLQAVLNTSLLVVDIPPEVAVSTAQGGRTHKHGDVIQVLPSDCLWDTTCDPGAVIRLFVGHITCSRCLHQTVCETHHLIQVL
ncbi:unnamed protein product [Boreogadus saida]